MVYIYSIEKAGRNGRKGKDETRRAEHAELQEKILKLLDSEIDRQKIRAKLQADLDAVELAPDVRVLPQPDTLDSLQRYQAANAREFTHLLDALERIRRMEKDD